MATSASASAGAASSAVTSVSTSSTCVSPFAASPPLSTAVAVSETSVKRSEITAEEKLRVLSWHHANGSNQRRTAAHFRASEPHFNRLNQATVSRWLLSERKFKKLVQSHQEFVIRDKSVKHPEVERCLSLWLDRLPINQYMKLTGKQVKDVARSFYECLEVPADERLELSNGWLSRFQTRHGLKLQKTPRRSTGADTLEREQLRLQRVIEEFLAAGEGRTLDDVWAMDETSFFYDCSPVVAQDEDVAVVEKAKKRLTVTLATNATGSERLEPIVIAHKSHDKISGCQKLYCNSTAWMTGDIFCVWLKSWNQELVNTGRHVLLLVDTFRGHKADLTDVANIQLEFVSPAVTGILHPGCIALNYIFHANYRQLVVHRVLARLRSSQECDNLFEIDLPESVTLIKAAWQNVEESAIAICWKQAQVIPIHCMGIKILSSCYMIQHDESILSQMTNTLLLKPLRELQDALNVLSAEFQVLRLSVALHKATNFVELELENALGVNASVSELVEMIRQNDSLNGKDFLVADINDEIDANNKDEVVMSAEAALYPASTSQPTLFASSINSSDVLDSLIVMENYWRSTGATLPSEMLDLLLRTRERLRCERAHT